MITVKVNERVVDVTTINVKEIDSEDYPQFCDSYVASARYVDGEALSTTELEILKMKNPDLVNELAHEQFRL